ncbi:hypothetical protein [Paraburkholderia tropica]|uniref:hypothetical protein n=1 Tax=Paraburkholderia tropica TaxID=92647 RepID=UPI0011B4D0AA|nr:hypothetical protein [Paraburkholderia tropica]
MDKPASIPVLTHERFVRAPVENRRRPGRYPKSVVRLCLVRRERRDDEARLRAWARDHANACWTLDHIRKEKQRHDAFDLLEGRNDEIWRSIKQLQEDAAALLVKASRLKCLLVTQQVEKEDGQGGHHGQ